LAGICFSQTALCELLSHTFFFKDRFDFACFGTSENFDNVFGELESSDGDDLSANTLSINQNPLVVKDIDNSGKLSCIGSVINSGDATDFYELCISLNERTLTMWSCGELY
jgi:hypothetical protein